MSVTPATMRRLMRELTELKKSPPEGIRVQTSEDNMLDVTGIIQGPEGTPYAGGYFRVKFRFTEEFPAAPPKCWFATKIFHPNVSNQGEICVNTLKKDWKSSYGIAHILVTVKCLLIYPNPDSALDEEAGKLLQENYDSYCDRAKLITSVHATPKVPPSEFATPKSDDAPSTSTLPPAPAPSDSLDVNNNPPTSSTIPAKSISSGTQSPSSPSQPLQQSASNTRSVSSLSSLPSGEKGAPSPLGTADSNVATGNAASSAKGTRSSTGVKRGAAPGIVGGEKRKKALKRL